MTEWRQLCPKDKSDLIQRISSLLSQRREVDFACVHGSFLETELAFRDIDLAVWVEPSHVKRDTALDYQWELSAWLEKDIPHPVDTLVLNYSSVGIQYNASGGRLVWAKDPVLWYNFREQTWLRYFDFAPLAQRMLLDLLRSTPR